VDAAGVRPDEALYSSNVTAEAFDAVNSVKPARPITHNQVELRPIFVSLTRKM
jgi:hypothetical protein